MYSLIATPSIKNIHLVKLYLIQIVHNSIYRNRIIRHIKVRINMYTLFYLISRAYIYLFANILINSFFIGFYLRNKFG